MRAGPSATAASPLRTLLRDCQRQRPLRAGSLIITIFGDAVAPRGGALTLGSLIRLAAPFGLAERAVRTAVARLAREGWLSARRAGRRSEYRLTRSGAQRFAEATRRIYGENPSSWNGHWTLVLLPAAGPRPAAREAMRWLGFGQLGPGLFAHPACTVAAARRALRSVPGGSGALWLQSSGAGLAEDRKLVARGWDLGLLARRYRRFVTRFEPLEPFFHAEPVEPETAFVVRTLLIHEYRKIHLEDPLLPPELLPADWVGATAYEVCRRLYARVFAPAERHLSEQARQLSRPLPVSSAAAWQRFGGLRPRQAGVRFRSADGRGYRRVSA
jgi:phenylacetic acid degradation operon negative regulatory protein